MRCVRLALSWLPEAFALVAAAPGGRVHCFGRSADPSAPSLRLHHLSREPVLRSLLRDVSRRERHLWQPRVDGFVQYNPVSNGTRRRFASGPPTWVCSTTRVRLSRPVSTAARWMVSFGAKRRGRSILPPAAKSARDERSGASGLVGDEAMAYVDCDTIPYLWTYANRFALFDELLSRRACALGAEQRRDHRGAKWRNRVRALRRGRSALHGAAAWYERSRRSDVRRSRPGLGPYNSVERARSVRSTKPTPTCCLNLEGDRGLAA